MNMPSRIGLLTPAWPGHATPNGIATSVYNLAIGLQRIGHTPVILATTLDGPAPEDIPVVPLPPKRWSLLGRVRMRFGDLRARNEGFVASLIAAANTAKTTHGMDALIMEESFGWAREVERATKIPVAIALHGPTALLSGHYRPDASITLAQKIREDDENRAFREATALIAPSRHVLEGMEAILPLEAIPRIVLPNSFTAPDPDPLPAARDPREILFVGRFDHLKGGDTVMQAMAHLVETHPHARLTFAGPDNGLDREDGSKLGIEDVIAALPDAARARISYFGPATRDEVADLRTRHAIALIASRYENLNYSLLEAMGAGQAIVSTAVGGPSEVLTDGETALMAPPADAPAMAAALARLLDDAALTERLGRAALAKVQRDFDPEVIAAHTLDFLRQVMVKA